MLVSLKRFILNKCVDLLPSSCFGYRRFILRMMGVKIAKNARVNSGFRVYGPGSIEIGEHVWIGQNCRIYTAGFNRVKIGENCEIGPETAFNCQSHITGEPEHRAGRCIMHDIELSKGIWCGMRVLILCSKIGGGTVIGAGSVVLQDIPSNVLAAGSPAVIKRKL